MTQTEMLRFVQSFASPVLDPVFIGFTLLGSEEFFMIALGALYWCVDKRRGFAMTVVVTGAFWLNAMLKEIFHTPRPSPTVFRVLFPESASGYAFPSGHTQSSLTFWGALPRYFRVQWAVTAGLIIVPVVALSRLYLGVHWPIDIVGGAFFGALSLVLLSPISAVATDWSRRTGTVLKTIVAILLPLAAMFVFVSDNNAKMAGVVSGFLIGAMAETRFVRFSVAGPKVRQIQKFLLGVVVVMGARIGLKLVLSSSILSLYIRYTAIGAVGAYVVPALFVALRLAEREPSQR